MFFRVFWPSSLGAWELEFLSLREMVLGVEGFRV